MVCDHLKELNKLIKKNDIAVSSSDLVHFVCKKCNVKETCETEPFVIDE